MPLNLRLTYSRHLPTANNIGYHIPNSASAALKPFRVVRGLAVKTPSPRCRGGTVRAVEMNFLHGGTNGTCQIGIIVLICLTLELAGPSDCRRCWSSLFPARA